MSTTYEGTIRDLEKSIEKVKAHKKQARDALEIKSTFPSLDISVTILSSGIYLTAQLERISSIAPVLQMLGKMGYKRTWVGDYNKETGSLCYVYGWIYLTAVIITSTDGPTCRRVKVGTRIEEVSVYEVICTSSEDKILPEPEEQEPQA